MKSKRSVLSTQHSEVAFWAWSAINMNQAIDTITIRGFKSIRRLDDFPLAKLNVLIGANGSGKSNFVSFFTFLREVVEGRLQKTVNLAGRADALLHHCSSDADENQVFARLVFGANAYSFKLERTNDNRLIFDDERIVYDGTSRGLPVNRSIGSGHDESKLKEQIQPGNKNNNISIYIYNGIKDWIVYHFHDTSLDAKMRSDQSVRDWDNLRFDASNIAPFLLKMQKDEPRSYELIRDTVRLIAPFFDDFLLRPQDFLLDELVRLEWKQKGSDFPFQPTQLSDGTIRFICLATVLLQPTMPGTIVIDEPELGLHPYAISILAALIHSASERSQVIISTQSVTLLDHFDPSDIVVVNREKGQSTLRRLDKDSLKVWLDEYSVGDLWEKNVVEAGPTNE